jgi:hypothetical protein
MKIFALENEDAQPESARVSALQQLDGAGRAARPPADDDDRRAIM